ncbi:hypothetical protein L1999_03780 [Neobacillus drentensis]|uniref:hypothetical protein n=1 Tax=Neobacillus drentensis TaxID=220684 RepID=UPI001F24FB1B|nr:hypothetical protein [Neobacillus drentensis]ULT57692.1 hypothetical protein L1999_03780 [Neobacillus drentensis]
MLSFEEKKAIFHSFKLKEKMNGNGKVSFVYPESIQKGQTLATQLHPSGNGYVIGKYMSEDTIKKHGFQVDPRGWISIKVLSKEEITKVITEAINSMSGGPVDVLLPESEGAEQEVAERDDSFEAVISEKTSDPVEASVSAEDFAEIGEERTAVASEKVEGPAVEKIPAGRAERENEGEPVQQGTYEFYPGSCLFAWMGLTLSTMEYGYLVWKKTFQNIVGAGLTGDKD